MSKATPEETALTKVRKLSHNRQCINCDHVNKFGHQHVVEKLSMFVCSSCKSAFQSFSFRVKSVTMSNWTLREIDALRDTHGGGNRHAALKWLAKWNPHDGQCPKPKPKVDHLDVFKAFVQRVYLDQEFVAEASEDSESNSPQVSASQSSNIPVMDLLDFSPSSKAVVPPAQDLGPSTGHNVQPEQHWDPFGVQTPPQFQTTVQQKDQSWDPFPQTDGTTTGSSSRSTLSSSSSNPSMIPAIPTNHEPPPTYSSTGSTQGSTPWDPFGCSSPMFAQPPVAQQDPFSFSSSSVAQQDPFSFSSSSAAQQQHNSHPPSSYGPTSSSSHSISNMMMNMTIPPVSASSSTSGNVNNNIRKLETRTTPSGGPSQSILNASFDPFAEFN